VDAEAWVVEAETEQQMAPALTGAYLLRTLIFQGNFIWQPPNKQGYFE
jgi:hypothetical protein